MLNYNKILSTKEANKVKNKVFTLLKDAYAIEDEIKSINLQSNDKKQKAIAGLYKYSKSIISSSSKAEYKKQIKQFVAEFFSDVADKRITRLKAKIVRALTVMHNNKVKKKDTLNFIKKYTLKNLYNGLTAPEAKKRYQQNADNRNNVMNILKEKTVAYIKFDDKSYVIHDKSLLQQIIASSKCKQIKR